jgi:MerR HTH family regulatory protein
VTLLSSDELGRAAGVSFRQVDHWVSKGLLVPAVPATGSGTFRKFTEDEAVLARVMLAWSETTNGQNLLPVEAMEPLRRAIALQWTNVLMKPHPDVSVIFDLDAARKHVQDNLHAPPSKGIFRERSPRHPPGRSPGPSGWTRLLRHGPSTATAGDGGGRSLATG